MPKRHWIAYVLIALWGAKAGFYTGHHIYQSVLLTWILPFAYIAVGVGMMHIMLWTLDLSQRK